MAASQKVVLYTCITNNRDVPKTIEFKNNFSYVMFSDQHSALAYDWTVKPLVWKHPTDPVRTARYHKHHPHLLFPEHDISIWLDATHWPSSDLTPLLECVQDHEIAAMRHFSRRTVFSEAIEVLFYKLDDPTTVLEHMRRYTERLFPDDLGLYSTSCLVRRHTHKLVELQNMWWSEMVKGSKRDQLSFTYCLWKLSMQCATIPGFCRIKPNAFFNMKSHYNQPVMKLL
jgi:hypothetical protein